MAAKITAIAAFHPRIKLERGAGFDEVVELIARQARMREGKVIYVLKEFQKALVSLTMQGRPVKINGFATFKPAVKSDGTFKMRIQSDPALSYDMNCKGGFLGTVINRDMIGKTAADLVTRWNRERPHDPVDQ